MSAGPLSGIRVLDTTRALSGPLCTMILGDMGADVIKVEMPNVGDETRRWTIPKFGTDATPTMVAFNRNKRSITLDLHAEEARQSCLRLARTCDVFVENFRPGTIKRFGLDYESLKAIRPDIVYCSVSGYGQSGPLSSKPVFDLMVQAASGLMALTGEPDGQPVKAAAPVADMMGGLSAAIAVLGALLERARTGEGRYIDVSMLDGMLALQGQAVAGWGMKGDVSARHGNGHPFLSPYQSFTAADRDIVVSVSNQKTWTSFCNISEFRHFAEDARFATQPLRNQHRDILVPALQDIFATRPAEHWLAAFQAAGIPAELIFTLPEILDHEQVRSRGMLIDVEYPPGSGNLITTAGMPWRAAAADRPVLSPPGLGQHTEEILREADLILAEMDRNPPVGAAPR